MQNRIGGSNSNEILCVCFYPNQRTLGWIGSSFAFLIVPQVYHTSVRPSHNEHNLNFDWCTAGLYVYSLWYILLVLVKKLRDK